MSKMIRLLKKANQARETQNNMFGVNAEPIDNGYEAINNASNSSDQSLAAYKLTVILMVFVVFVAVASLYVSFKAIVQLQKSQEVSAQLISGLELRDFKINTLEHALLGVQTKSNEKLTSLNAEVERLSSVVKQKEISSQEAEEKLQELYGKYQAIKDSNEDMRATNRLILQKYINLNQEVKELQIEKAF